MSASMELLVVALQADFEDFAEDLLDLVARVNGLERIFAQAVTQAEYDDAADVV